MRYNGTNFILQGSDSAGNATPGDVLSGKTFSNGEDTDLVGTMPSRTGHVTAQGFLKVAQLFDFDPSPAIMMVQQVIVCKGPMQTLSLPIFAKELVCLV